MTKPFDMFEVYCRHTVGEYVVVHRVITVGENDDDAIGRVSHLLSVDASQSPGFRVTRLVPKLFKLDEHRIPIHGPRSAAKRKNGKAADAGFRADYFISIEAQVACASENGALRKLANYILRKCGHNKADDKDITDVNVNVDRVTNFGNELKRPYIEKQAVLTDHQFYGGAKYGLKDR